MASSPTEITGLLQSIGQYRQKYYQNQLLKGGLVSLALLLALFLFVNTLEYFGRFNSLVRGALLFGYVGIFCFICYRWLVRPLIHLTGLKKPISNEEAARQIGKYFPEIGDKLINTLQLSQLPGSSSELIQAGIRQKSGQLLIVKFSDAIKFGDNRRYAKYAAYPFAAIAMILLFNPDFFSTSSERIIRFNTRFNYAPFSFHVENKNLKAFRNEDFVVRLRLDGNTLPPDVYLVMNGTRFKLHPEDQRHYSYTFKNLQRDLIFTFEGGGYQSEPFKVQLLERPGLLSFDVNLHYPAYLRKPAETLTNAGNLTVPEGTRIEWQFKTTATRNLSVLFENDSTLRKIPSGENNRFVLNHTVRRSSSYRITLSNDDLPEGQQFNYFVNVIPDRYPELAMENFQDTTMYNYLVAGGSISDDYGFTKLRLFYTIRREGQNEKPESYPASLEIPVNKQTNTQSFYFQWFLDSLRLQPGDNLEYYAQVWDNDGVNGPKSTRSTSRRFVIPEKKQLTAEIEKSVKETREQIEKTLNKAKGLEKEIQNLENRLKTNNELDFQERKQAEDILRKRQELLQEIQAIQEKNQASNDKSRQFDQQQEAIRKKMDELQKLMNELTDKETEKLYEELEKLLEQKQSERMTQMLEKLRNRERNTQKELERTLNLFKKLQLEQKMETAARNLEELADKQDQLAEDTEKKEKEETGQKNPTENDKNETLSKKQEALEKELDENRKELDAIEKAAEELNKKEDLPKEELNNAAEEQKASREELRNQQRKKAAQSQKKAAKSMRSAAGQMKQQMADGGAMEAKENIDDLRDILENLLTLSFDQEQLMKDFRGVTLSDPRFIPLGQQQLKLSDDAKVVEDSLYALANRVEQLKSPVMRELNNMRYSINETVKNIRERRLPQIPPRQQYSMTSMNNLALMLGDALRQMQQAMMMAMPGSSGKKGPQSPSQMQMELNEKMEQMGDGKKGQGQGNTSEQLARMAAEQAAIREALRKLIDGSKGTRPGQQYGKELQEMMEQMEKSETEIVNKRVNQELIKRNKEMVTRLLESEKAMREQDEDEERKGETARPVHRQPPPAFEQYIRDKEQQTELLRTVPANFAPFYKRETDAYFQKYRAGK